MDKKGYKYGSTSSKIVDLGWKPDWAGAAADNKIGSKNCNKENQNHID